MICSETFTNVIPYFVKKTTKAINANKAGTIIANAVPVFLIMGVYFLWFNPNDWNALWKPCNKW